MKLYTKAIIFLCINSIFINASKLNNSRIIGGNVAYAGQFPWQAAIYITTDEGTFFCGGALITNQFVLTAGHCVYNAKQFTIYLGSNTLQSSDENRVILSTSTYFIHPEYDPLTLEHDIGLIKLHMSVTFTDYLQKVSVSNGHTGLYEGTTVTATGWGQTSDVGASLSNELNYVELVVISNTECQITYGTQIKYGMVCAIGNYNEGICLGDTGSPIIKPGVKGEPLHVGIASFMSQNGCETAEPTGYTRSDIYSSWIANVTNDNA